jgi:type III restriction enzyme
MKEKEKLLGFDSNLKFIFSHSALQTGELDLPEEFKPHTPQIAAVLKKVSVNLNIKNRDDKKKVSLNKAVFLNEEFKQLWDRIKYQTTFRVDFDVDALTAKCAEEIKANLHVGKARFIYRKAKAEINRGGVHAQQVQETASVYESRSFELPDLITYLQNQTKSTLFTDALRPTSGVGPYCRVSG